MAEVFEVLRATCLVAFALEALDLWLEVGVALGLFAGFDDRFGLGLLFAAIGRLTLKYRRMGNLYGLPIESQATEDGSNRVGSLNATFVAES